MKQLTSLFALFVLVILVTSCGGDAKSKITGKWKMTDLQNAEMDQSKMSADDKKQLEDMMKQMKEKSSFEFNADGKFEIKMNFMGNETKESGTWELDKEGKTLITKSTEGKETKLAIEELTASKVVLSVDKNKFTLEK